MSIIADAGTGIQLGSVGSAFALAVMGTPLAPVAAICGTSLVAGTAMRMV